MPRKTITTCPGLWTGPNAASAPPGALAKAAAVVIKRPNLIESLRPLKQYSSYTEYTGAFAGGITNLAMFSGQLVAATGSGQLAVETAAQSGILNVVSSAYSVPGSGTHVFLEANGNLYTTTGAGMRKLESVTATPFAAGIPRALDVQLTLVAAGTLLANTQSVGYRVTFGYLDANQNLVVGPPSGRATVTATAAQNVTVKAWVPSQITSASNATSYFVQVHRTFVQSVASTDPGEEMQVVYQAYLTSTDVSNKFISFTDATPDALRGATGYFCPSQEGIAQANYQPPLAQDCALFKGSTFYANTVSKHRVRVQLLGVSKNLLTISTGAGGITKSGGNGVYTFTGSPDLTNILTDGTAKLSVVNCTTAGNNGEFPITAVNTGAFTITVTNAGAATEAGTATARAFPSKLTIAGVNYYGVISSTAETPGSQLFKVSTGNAISGTSSPQQDVADTAASLLRVVNQQASPTVCGYYESGPDDGAGKMMFEETSIGGAQFSLSAGGTLLYNSFSPSIPVAAPWKSQNDTAKNRIYVSKQNQPEHVPLAQYYDVGAKSKAILRVLTLREAMLVFKEDGLYRVTGDGAGNFSVTLFDASVRLVNPTYWSFGLLNNRAYCHTLNGAVAISESSITLIDEAVSNSFRVATESSATAHVVISEIDQLIYFWMGTSADSNALVYSVRTQAWTSTGTPVAWGAVPYFYHGLCLNSIPYRFDLNGSIFTGETLNSNENIATGWQQNNTPPPATKLLVSVTAVTGVLSVSQLDYSFAQLRNAVDTSATDQQYTLYIKGNKGGSTAIYKIASYTGSGGTTTSDLTLAASPFSSLAALASDFVTGHAYVWLANTPTVEWLPYSNDIGGLQRVREAAILTDGAGTLTTANVYAMTEGTDSMAGTRTGISLIAGYTSANTPIPTNTTGITLLRCTLPPLLQHNRRLGVRVTGVLPAEYMVICGVSYEFDPLDGNEVT